MVEMKQNRSSEEQKPFLFKPGKVGMFGTADFSLNEGRLDVTADETLQKHRRF